MPINYAFCVLFRTGGSKKNTPPRKEIGAKAEGMMSGGGHSRKLGGEGGRSRRRRPPAGHAV